MTDFDAIIFDLGGVVIDLDFGRTSAAFKALGSSGFDTIWKPLRQEPFFEHYETGQIDSATFRQHLRTALKLEADDAAMDAAWNAMIVGFPKAHGTLLLALQKRYRVFALSNTNAIHLQRIDAMCHEHDAMSHYFEKAYYSHHIFARKPDPKAFTTVLEANNLQPERVLFVDDYGINIDSAKKLGLVTHHHVGGGPLGDLFGSDLRWKAP